MVEKPVLKDIAAHCRPFKNQKCIHSVIPICVLGPTLWSQTGTQKLHPLFFFKVPRVNMSNTIYGLTIQTIQITVDVIFHHLSGSGHGGNSLSPDFPLPDDFVQQFLWNPEAFPGQPRDIVSPVCPGSSPEKADFQKRVVYFIVEQTNEGCSFLISEVFTARLGPHC